MVKTKKTPKCTVCGTEKEVSFEGDGVQYPVFCCPEHGPDERNEWKIWWDKYSELWKQKDKWNSKADKASCLVGYFCSLYKDFYGNSYAFDYSNPIPYKSKEFVMTRRILAMFENDAIDAKVYIRWAFAKKAKTRNYPVTSLGFFASAPFINEYKIAKENSKVLKRHTRLPEVFVKWCEEKEPEVFQKHDLNTWNDLNNLVAFAGTYGKSGVEGKIVEEAVHRGMLPQTGFRKLED